MSTGQKQHGATQPPRRAEKKGAGCFPADAIWHGETYTWEEELPMGEWNVMASGRIHQLRVTRVSDGDVTGEYNTEPIENGLWDGRALTFTRVVQSAGLRQHFTGYLMPHVASDYCWRIAGTFEQETPPQPELNMRGGWYATLPRETEE